MRIGKHIPSDGVNGEDHGDGGEAMVIKCLGLENKKEKNKKRKAKVKLYRRFLVW